jgi:hypothetical protein
VPELTPALIRRIKQAALAAAPAAVPAGARALRDTVDALRPDGGKSSGFIHPGGYAGAEELALLRERLEGGAPLQAAAKESLLTVRGVVAGVGVGWGWVRWLHDLVRRL